MTPGNSTYLQLLNTLEELIEASPGGTKLPPEPQLASELGVSRATLREGMRTFESRGFLRRRQGVGTFVVKPAHIIETRLEILESIETLAKKVDLTVSMTALKIRRVVADENQATQLQLTHNRMLIEVKRIIVVDGAPTAYLVDILPEHVIDLKIIERHFTGSMLDLLKEVADPPLVESKAEISAVQAQSTVARALDIQRGSTLLLLSGLLLNIDETPVDLSYSYFLPGYFKLTIGRRINY